MEEEKKEIKSVGNIMHSGLSDLKRKHSIMKYFLKEISYKRREIAVIVNALNTIGDKKSYSNRYGTIKIKESELKFLASELMEICEDYINDKLQE